VRVSRENWDLLNDDQKRGLIIRGYRKRHPYSVKEVSRLSGIKIGRIRDIEAGRRKPLKLEELLALNKTCFLLPLKAFEHLFPSDISPYDYANQYRGKNNSKNKKRKRK